MTQMFQEFPKALYMGGDVTAECFIVFDRHEEYTKRWDGFYNPGESLEKSELPAPKKRGRPRKVADGTD